MPLLTQTDPLPRRPCRVLTAGASGSGKTTLAAMIAARLQIDHVEIDALFHGPGWTRRPSFEADVARLARQPEWVTEWQYGYARPVLAARADLLVWLDISRLTVMKQVVRRTVRRRLHRQVLWNGNVEPGLRTVFFNRDHIIRWAWSTHHETAVRIRDLLLERPDLSVVRLPGHDAASQWLSTSLAAAEAKTC